MAENLSVSSDGKKARRTGPGVGHNTSVKLATPPNGNINAIKIDSGTSKTKAVKASFQGVELKPEFADRAKEINTEYGKILDRLEEAASISRNRELFPSDLRDEHDKAYKRSIFVKDALSDEPFEVMPPSGIGRPKTYRNYLSYVELLLADAKTKDGFRAAEIVDKCQAIIDEIHKVRNIGKPALEEATETYRLLDKRLDEFEKSVEITIQIEKEEKAYREAHYNRTFDTTVW